MNKPTLKSTYVLCMLALLLSGCSDRKVLSEIPSEFRGVWTSMYGDPEILLIIKRGAVNVVDRERPSFLCRAEEIISYKTGWVFKEKKIAVVCDKNSTAKDQKIFEQLGVISPDDYRKTYYFSLPNKFGVISVSNTKYMSKGWSGSEGTYVWDLDEFQKR